MLPFDLHVLGMPPAFNLSQDQTLHLKLLMTEAIYLLSESLESQASLLTLGISDALLMDSSSHHRRPHKLPAHTVKDLVAVRGDFRLNPRRLTFRRTEPHILHRF